MNKTTLQVKDWLAHRLDSAISDSGMKIEAICKKPECHTRRLMQKGAATAPSHLKT
jgi:hypothetical protein